MTKKQNLLETIRGEKPEQFVNQYEAFKIIKDSPYFYNNASPKLGETNVVNSWGVTLSWPKGTPGIFPVHSGDKIVCKDVTRWRDYVHAPKVDYPEADWEPYLKIVEQIDRNEYFVTPMVYPGIFEQCHYLLEIQNCLVNFYDEPESMHELIEYITEWELAYAEQLCKYYKPDALFHHDDWGSQLTTFLAPEMFEEFFLEPYKRVYGYYKSHGVQVIVHHSDSYAATLVPYMIDMGIDIWQGVIKTNNIHELIQKYGGQISFMGGIDSSDIDKPDWTPEHIAKEVEYACQNYGKLYFIPNATQGGPMSTFPGVYDTVTSEIEKQSSLLFK